MQPFGGLLREPEQILDSQSLQFREVIAERTALRCTAARARYHFPSRRILDPRFARARIGVNDSPSGKGREPDSLSVPPEVSSAHGRKVRSSRMMLRELAEEGKALACLTAR